MGSVNSVERTVADSHGFRRRVEEDPAVGMAVGTGSDYDLVFHETLFRVYHRRHLQFTSLNGFVHRLDVDSIKILIQPDAFLARTRFIERRPMATYKNY